MTVAPDMIGPDISHERWMREGLCRQQIQTGEAEAWWWYPERGMGPHGASRAIPVCEDCPVLEPCRAWGLRWERYGIWGGLTETQREKLRGAQVSKVCPECKTTFTTVRGRGGQQEATCSPECRELRRQRQRDESDLRRGIKVGVFKDAGHGTRKRYQRGCRCAACRKAERVYMRRRRTVA